MKLNEAALICQHCLCRLWKTSTTLCVLASACCGKVKTPRFVSSPLPLSHCFRKKKPKKKTKRPSPSQPTKQNACWKRKKQRDAPVSPAPAHINTNTEDKQRNHTSDTNINDNIFRQHADNTAEACCPRELFCCAVSGDLCSPWKTNHMFSLSKQQLTGLGHKQLDTKSKANNIYKATFSQWNQANPPEQKLDELSIISTWFYTALCYSSSPAGFSCLPDILSEAK